MDPKVLSYHDSLLRKSDVMLLEKGNWLNDKLIGFMFEYFQHELFDKHSQVLSFLDPDVVQLVKLSAEEDVQAILSSLELDSKKFVFLSINDNEESLQAGGQHWSLLVYDKSTSTFEHYDSCNNSNRHVAEDVCKKFSKILTKNTTKVSHMSVATQENGYDCGVYVVKIAEEICRSKLQGRAWDANSLTASVITNERLKMKVLIKEKAAPK